LFHTDAVQALGRVPLEVEKWGIDLASFAVHKLGGPVGVGVLFRRTGVALQPLAFGGEQEGGLRPGTENVAAIVAASVALELAVRERAEFAKRAARFARILWEELGVHSNHIRLLGPELSSAARLPGTLNLVAENVDGRVLVTQLDLAGVEASAGSACASGSLEPSHVLLALGLDERRARAGLRLSIGRETTLAAVRQAVDILRRTLGARGATRAGDKGS
jgi:cysteine desulfurase